MEFFKIMQNSPNPFISKELGLLVYFGKSLKAFSSSGLRHWQSTRSRKSKELAKINSKILRIIISLYKLKLRLALRWLIMLPFFIIVLILAGALVGQILWGNQREEPVGKHSAKRKA